MPSRSRRPDVDLSVYAVEDWLTLRALLADGARGLPPVLHPLRAEQFLRLDRGDRDLLPRGHRLHGLGHVRPPRAGTSRSTSCSATCRPARPACWRPLSTSSARLFFAYAAWLVWHFMSLIEGETMTTIDLPMSLVYGAVCLGFVLMVAALDPGGGRATGAAATPCWSAPRPSTPPRSEGRDHAAPARLLPRPDADRRARWPSPWPWPRCSTSWSPASRPTSSWPSG